MKLDPEQYDFSNKLKRVKVKDLEPDLKSPHAVRSPMMRTVPKLAFLGAVGVVLGVLSTSGGEFPKESLAAGPPDPWVQVVGNGFGDPGNLGISTFHAFQGQLYAATNRRDNAPATFGEGLGPVQLWRSSDGQSWSQVTAFSPPLNDANHGLFFMADSGPTTPQYFYLSTTGGDVRGPIVYRSSDGTSWTQINGAGTSFDKTENKSMTALAVKDTRGTRYLYTGTQNDRGAQVWRIPYDATSGWEKVLDFAAVDSSVSAITYLTVWKDMLVAGTLGGGPARTGAHIYTSASGDAGTWLKNAAVGDGFGSLDNINVAAIAEFDGFLYVSTQNRITGGQLWRSADGQTWSQVVKDGFGNVMNNELHRLAVAHGYLWATTFTVSPSAAQVWRSGDGLTFVQSNTDGFGDPNTVYGYPPVIGFKDEVFWGGQNKTTGGQVWGLNASQLSPPPMLISPPLGVTLPSLGTILSWLNPPNTTQYQLQMIPANNDGPGINLIRNAETSYTVQPPVMGQGNYVLLPGMTYTWRVRATSKSSFAPESDPSWGPWSPTWTFRTPPPTSATISPVFPANGSTVASTAPLALQWQDASPNIFYYEVQASPDPNFGEQGAVASVWHNLVHGGVTNPLNSWLTPQLQPGTTYYWRVRPRVQGDGTPVAWSQTWSFRTQ